VTRRSRLWRELGAVVRLALPVVSVQLGMMLMGVVDTMMLGRVSAGALAAGALGDSLSFSVMILAVGILMAVDPLVSQAHGAEDRAAIAAYLERGLVLAVVLSLPLSCCGTPAPSSPGWDSRRRWSSEARTSSAPSSPESSRSSSSWSSGRPSRRWVSCARP
jgi:Na+-driven multidrug efflux pump